MLAHAQRHATLFLLKQSEEDTICLLLTFLERYGNWTTDKKWLVKHLVTGTVTLWKLDNRQEMAGQTSCYRDSNVMETGQPTRNGWSNILLHGQ